MWEHWIHPPQAVGLQSLWIVFYPSQLQVSVFSEAKWFATWTRYLALECRFESVCHAFCFYRTKSYTTPILRVWQWFIFRQRMSRNVTELFIHINAHKQHMTMTLHVLIRMHKANIYNIHLHIHLCQCFANSKLLYRHWIYLLLLSFCMKQLSMHVFSNGMKPRLNNNCPLSGQALPPLCSLFSSILASSK